MIAGEVHVWVTPLDGDDADAGRLRVILDQEELERAARFRSPTSRWRFSVKHAVRRRLLAEYLGSRPQDIGFVTTAEGKPTIDGESRLDFSDSASGALAVYAVASDMRLGIDIEQVRHVADAPKIVARYGSVAERAAFGQVADAERDVAFLRWWTAKEAMAKATGSGLQAALDRFSVSFPSSDGVRLLEVLDGGNVAADFSLTELKPAEGYVGTLVAIGRPQRIRQGWWHPLRPLGARGAA